MVAHVRLFDETATGERTPAAVIELDTQTVTVREIIRRRVEHEVAIYNVDRDQSWFKGLIQPTDSEQTLNGYRLRRPRKLDPVAQAETAYKAFDSNGFFVLINDVQADSLDHTVELRSDVDVSFIKLTPLVGG